MQRNFSEKSSVPTANIDTTKLNRSLVTLVLFVGTIFIAIYTIMTGNPVLMLGFVVLPFVLMLLNRPELVFVIAVILDATKIPMPFVSGATLGLFAKMLLIGTALLGIALKQRQWIGVPLAERRPLKLMVAIIIMLMMVRGSGLKILGSSTWGGMMYIIFIIGIVFYFFVNGLRLSKRHVKSIVWFSLVAGLIGSIIGRIGWLGVAADASEVMAKRLGWLTPIAYAMLPFVFALKLKHNRWINILLLLVCIGMIGLSGFRSRLVGTVIMTAGCWFFLSKNKTRYILSMMIVGIVSWVLLLSVAPALPSGLQRAVSFVPGINVDTRVAEDAKHSTEWRVDIWMYCLDRVPEYLLIGRGSAFNVWDAAENLSKEDIQMFTPWFAFQTRSYHSGPLTLLVDYGLAGLIVGAWLGIVLFRKLWGIAKQLAIIDTFESRYAVFLCVSLMWAWFAFFFVFGDVRMFADKIAETATVLVISLSVLSLRNSEDSISEHACPEMLDGAPKLAE